MHAVSLSLRSVLAYGMDAVGGGEPANRCLASSRIWKEVTKAKRARISSRKAARSRPTHQEPPVGFGRRPW